jgi:pyruvate kinase
MVAAGMDMARVSLAHGPVEESIDRMARVRAAAAAEGRIVGVMADLPGPKVRAAAFPEGGVYLTEGSMVELVPTSVGDSSGSERIAVDQPDLLVVLRPADRVAIGDGGIALAVIDVDAARAVAQVLTGGRVQGRPGVSLPPERLTMAMPTEEDLRLLKAVAATDVDAVAMSFVRSAEDVERVRAAAGPGGPMLIAKIETQQAVDALDEIIAVSDGVMVARGDLGIRCALEDVPHYQKRIIRTGVAYGRPVITATQMLESMVQAPVPTRAEVSDVANAVFDGTSALMLSGETAIGHDPVNAVRTMARIATRAEREFDYMSWGRNLGRQQTAGTQGAPAPVRIVAAISAAGWRAAIDAEATAIIACTNSGATARAISRFRPAIPILAVTPSPRTARQLSVAWGITPILSELHGTTDDLVWFAVKAAVDLGIATLDDVVAVLVGSPDDPEPTTDILRLVRIR